MIWCLNILVQLLGLTGFGLLTVPALHAARYARALVDAHSVKPAAGAPGHEAHAAAVRALENLRDAWTRGKGFCLIAGTLLTAASYAVALLAGLLSPATL